VAPRGAPRYDGSLGPAHEERWAVSMTVVGDAERGENRGGGEFTMEEALPRGGGVVGQMVKAIIGAQAGWLEQAQLGD
jgi:hypothetical protein